MHIYIARLQDVYVRFAHACMFCLHCDYFLLTLNLSQATLHCCPSPMVSRAFSKWL